jgi:glycosyltransferase involved in cell wall biosynthesis
VGEFSGTLDEGMRKVTDYLSKELSKNHETLLLDVRNTFSVDFWSGIKRFRPEIIHYIHGPSIFSFVIAQAIKSRYHDAKVVMSAMHPGFYGFRGLTYGPSYAVSSLLKSAVHLLKPDLILTQSQATERMFNNIGCRTCFLPIGVDTTKFSPVSQFTKKRLREENGIDQEKFIILHIGTVGRGRNIRILKKLNGCGNQVLIVGRTSTRVERRLHQDLLDNGCIVWARYFPRIEEIYALSDCYIFPTVNPIASIESPLSVLEAMSCNLKVVTTRFGALPRIFQEDEGLVFADQDDDMVSRIQEVKNAGKVNNREKVLPYSWENTIKKLEDIYKQLLQ